MLSKCLALSGRIKFEWKGLMQRMNLRNMSNREAEELFWMTPELVEYLLSFLDPASILVLAKAHPFAQQVLQRGLNWTRMIKRSCPQQSLILQKPFELQMAAAARALEPIIETLHLLGKSESRLLQLLEIICERFPSNNSAAGPDLVKVACPCLEVHEVSSLGLVLLEMVERSTGTCLQKIDLVFVWQITGSVLPFLKSRLGRGGGRMTKTVCDNFVFDTQEDTEAFLALAKIADSIVFRR